MSYNKSGTSFAIDNRVNIEHGSTFLGLYLVLEHRLLFVEVVVNSMDPQLSQYVVSVGCVLDFSSS